MYADEYEKSLKNLSLASILKYFLLQFAKHHNNKNGFNRKHVQRHISNLHIVFKRLLALTHTYIEACNAENGRKPINCMNISGIKTQGKHCLI